MSIEYHTDGMYEGYLEAENEDLRRKLAALQQLNQRMLRAIGDGEMQVFCDHDEDNDIFEEIEKLVGYPSDPDPEASNE